MSVLFEKKNSLIFKYSLEFCEFYLEYGANEEKDQMTGYINLEGKRKIEVDNSEQNRLRKAKNKIIESRFKANTT